MDLFDFFKILSKIFPFILIVGSGVVLGIEFYGRYREIKGPNIIAVAQPESVSLLITISVVILFFIYLLVQNLSEGNLGLIVIVELTFVGFIVFILFLILLSKAYILPDGIILYYFIRMYWGDIGAYYWDVKDPNLLHIFRKHRRRRHYKIRIPVDERELVLELLNTHLKSSEIT